MSTGQTLINRALRLIGALAAGETAPAADTADGLEALNAMLGTWRNERLLVYARQDETLSMVAGTASYTIGPSGNLNTTRPIRIEHAFMREASIDYPVQIITEKEYYGIADKTEQSDLVERIYYAPTMPTGTLYCHPVPNNTNVLHLVTWTPLATLASASTTVTLPPGYEDAIAFNLAARLAPEYGASIDPVIADMARNSKAAIRMANAPIIRACAELALLVGEPPRSNIETDQP